MGITNIAWTDFSFNGWVGCTEVGPPCDSCYARELDKRYMWGVDPRKIAGYRENGIAPHWGPGALRHRTSHTTWKAPAKWNRDAQQRGVPAKVFAHSLSDVFDNEVPEQWRSDLFELMRSTPWLRWQVLTKRLPNVANMLPSWWQTALGGLSNVGIVVSVGDQKEYMRDRERLMKLPFAWHGFSIEPQIECIDIKPDFFKGMGSVWFITGGESYQPTSPKPTRAYDVDWAREIIGSCAGHKNLFPFVKQLGSKPTLDSNPIRLKANAGTDPNEWPPDIDVRKFPPELLA